LAEAVSHAETVLFLDSTHEGIPGEFHCAEIHAADSCPSFTHHLSPESVLGIAHELYGVDPHAWLMTICGRNFGPGEVLSPEVMRCMPELKKRVREVTTETLGSCPIVS
jgi:hypothetical protein